MTAAISFLAPLPPAPLRSNSRVPWYVRVKAKQAYSQEVLLCVASDIIGEAMERRKVQRGFPWQRARVSYEWRYCGSAPDEQNLGANLKALTDILCCAPDNGMQRNETTYLGLVEDDRGIVPAYAMVRVAHRAEQGVYVTVEAL